MDDVARLLEGVGAVAWPALVIIAVFVFAEPIRGMFRRFGEGEGSIKAGGFEISWKEIAKQQADITGDLVGRVAALERLERVDTAAGRIDVPQNGPRSVLWVDDHPDNNTYLVELLRSRSIDVRLSLSTQDALRSLRDWQPDVVISDVGRMEANRWNPRAGLELATAVRGQGDDVPIVLFTTGKNVRKLTEEAKAIGVTGITSSASELLELVEAAE